MGRDNSVWVPGYRFNERCSRLFRLSLRTHRLGNQLNLLPSLYHGFSFRGSTAGISGLSWLCHDKPEILKAVIILHGQILILYNWRPYLSITPRSPVANNFTAICRNIIIAVAGITPTFTCRHWSSRWMCLH